MGSSLLSTAHVLNQSFLRVDTTLEALTPVIDWFGQFDHAPIPHVVWLQCQLALAEGFTNAVRHAHKALHHSTPIELELIVFDHYLELRIWDCGPPFDLDTFIAQLPEIISAEQEGGRGILLMKTIASRMDYTRTEDGRNCLLIVKTFQEDP